MSGAVLFRVEASPQVGLGHLRRSLSLASAFRRASFSSRFLVHGDNRSLQLAEQAGFPAERSDATPWEEEDAVVLEEAARCAGAKAVVVDSPTVSAGYLTRLREAGLFVVVRDDLAPYSFPSQLVLNGNANARQLPYRSCNGGTRFLLGPEYAVLPEEFRTIPPRDASGAARRLLLLLGGADPRGWMPRLIRLAEGLPGDLEVKAVVGPYFPERSEVERAAGQNRHPVRIVENPSSLFPLMVWADLAISAAGQTLYELACAGCPAVAFPVAANQEGQLRALTEAGCVWSAGGTDEPQLLSKIEETVRVLMARPDERARMAAAGQGLIDGQGACRVVREIVPNAS